MPKLDPANDFSFFEKKDGSKVRPLQILTPVLTDDFVGDGKKTARIQIYLADYSENSFVGPIVNKGYTSDEIVFIYMGGSKRTLPKQTK